jgi:hypothetical protein
MSIQRLSNSGQSGYLYKSLIAGITPVASVPTIGAATALTFSTASVTFTAPGAYAATTFTATSSPGGLTGTSATSPITVSGLSEQTAYTFTVTATNASGTSSPSAASSSITTPVAFTPEGAYDALATVTLSTSTSLIEFSGIPSGYKHLQIRGISRGASTGGSLIIRFDNNAVDANYSRHIIYGEGSGSVVSGGSFNDLPGTAVGDFPTSSATANVYASYVIDILDYVNVAKNKTVRSLSGYDANGSGFVQFRSGGWYSTSAIDTIRLYENGGSSFAANSSFALYGVK